MEDWVRFLTPHEAHALAEVEDWIESGGTGPVGRMLTLTHRPVEYVYRKLPQAVRDSLGRAIASVLHAMRNGSLAVVSRRTVLDRVGSVAGWHLRGPRDLFHVPLQVMARHLSITLAQRKVGQTVFLVGGVVGAGVNHQLARDVGSVAYHAYRRRFLRELASRRQAGEL